MSLSDFFTTADINKGLEIYKDTQGAILLDVRTPEEFGTGHIPGAKTMPLDNLAAAEQSLTDKGQAIFVYCHSGGRSAQAVKQLKAMGYTAVQNIGGIMHYRGQIER